MNESYEQELQQEINFLNDELLFLKIKSPLQGTMATRTNTPGFFGYVCPCRNSI